MHKRAGFGMFQLPKQVSCMQRTCQTAHATAHVCGDRCVVWVDGPIFRRSRTQGVKNKPLGGAGLQLGQF